jgi:hypothetical protein
LENADSHTGTTIVTNAHIMTDKEDVIDLIVIIHNQVRLMQSKRRLFILHYAGHGTANEKLLITPRIGVTIDKDDPNSNAKGPNLNMSLIKDSLQTLAANSSGLDILILLDCCCASTAGRGMDTIIGERLELMAATSRGGISNLRRDGKTFTQNWCEAFETFLDLRKPFNCNDLLKFINKDAELEQFPAAFVLQEGWGVPITFCALGGSSTLPPNYTMTVLTALHLVKDPKSDTINHLIRYLESCPVGISVLAAVPTSSTFLLLRIPLYLQEMLYLP